MKVLIFSTAYFPHVGGAEVAVKEITDRIGNVDFSVQSGPTLGWDMITVRLNKKDLPQEKIGNINVYRIGWGLGRLDKLLFPFCASRFANKLHKKNKYDVAWSIMASFSGFATLFFKKKNPDVKFLLTLQEGDDLSLPVRKSILVNLWFKQIFTRADYIQAISNYLAGWAKKMQATCPIEVVPNGVDFHSIKSKVHKIESTDKVILTTSRLVEKNGIEDLIKATQLLITNYKLQIKLIICGNGELENSLKQLAKDLKIEDKVKFAGFIEPKELEKYYAVADVFCRPSLTEGLGISFLEAFAYEIPVIATPVGGIPDFLNDEQSSSAKASAGKTGWFCEVNNPESIAEKIKYILDEKNKTEVEQVVRNAKKLVEEKYNWEKIAPQMRNIFSSLGGFARDDKSERQ